MKKQTILTALLVLFTMGQAWAWGGFAHRTVAEIAERNLTPKAKANIERYTGGTPLANYSTWMDSKKNPDYFKKAMRGWHASIVDAECRTSQDIRDKHRNGRDAVTGLLEFERMFKQRKQLSDSVVMFAIKCMVHMVGDMHCPAHVRFTDFENQGKFPVTFFGKKTSLHSVWDTAVLTRNHRGWKYQDYAAKLDCLSKKEAKKITRGWVEDWLEESGRVVRPTIRKVKRGDKLGAEFMEWGYPLAEAQAQKAGYRLAKVMNKFFK